MAALRPARPSPSLRARRSAAAGEAAIPEPPPPSAAELHSRRIFRNELNGLDAWSRHKYFVDTYLRVYGGAEKLAERQREAEKEYRTEFDVLKGNHQFLRSPDEDEKQLTWEQRVAKKYYDKLFKEYCIAELKRYDEGKIALRWRTHSEAVGGKGQFVCGALRCEEQEGLKSWEVNFAYSEGGERKNALVKLRLCPDCSAKLHHSHGEKDSSVAGEESRRHRKEEKRKRTGRPVRRAASSGGESSAEENDLRHRRRRRKSGSLPERADDVGTHREAAYDGSLRGAPSSGSESSSEKDDRHNRRRRRKSGRRLGRCDDVASDGIGGENGSLDGESSSEADDRLRRRRPRNSGTRSERGGDTGGDGTGGGKGSLRRDPSSGGESSSTSSENDDRSHLRRRRRSGRRPKRGGDTGSDRTDGEDGSLKKHSRRTASGVSEDTREADRKSYVRRSRSRDRRSADRRRQRKRRSREDLRQRYGPLRSRSPAGKRRSQKEISGDVDRVFADLFK